MLRDTLFKHQPEQSFHNAMVLANHLLHEADLDDTMSGTTAINVLLRGNMLYVANVGDSRAVLAERQGDGHVAVPLSMDQTPFRWADWAFSCCLAGGTCYSESEAHHLGTSQAASLHWCLHWLSIIGNPLWLYPCQAPFQGLLG